jgi:hypothetical protein
VDQLDLGSRHDRHLDHAQDENQNERKNEGELDNGAPTF